MDKKAVEREEQRRNVVNAPGDDLITPHFNGEGAFASNGVLEDNTTVDASRV